MIANIRRSLEGPRIVVKRWEMSAWQDAGIENDRGLDR